MSFNRKLLLGLVAVLLGYTAQAQDSTFSLQHEYMFANHLANQGDHHDAIYVLNRANVPSLSQLQSDSLNYLTGFYHYEIKELDMSVQHFKQVSPTSTFYLKSRFLGSFDYAYTNRPAEATAFLKASELPANDSKLAQLKNFELAGLALLRRDYDEFDTLSTLFTEDHYAFVKQQKKLLEMREQLNNTKRKSPLLGGLMSAVIPGSGKMYAGKWGEGMGAFSVVAGLGLATWESMRKDKRNNILANEGIIEEKEGISTQTYIFGTLFTIFYIGNIYGSVFTVKLKHNEQMQDINNQILFDLHVPLRTIFN